MFRHKFLSIVILAGLLLSQAVSPAQAETRCDSAQFVSDLTIPDGTTLTTGTAFTKSWRLLNNGTCTWIASYSVVWAGGDPLGAPASFRLPVVVSPGQMVDISVNLVAPNASGRYKAVFKLSNASGVQFGIGEESDSPFWVDINVIEVNATIYDFVANAPFALWKSGAGALPFPSASGDNRGYASQVNTPHLEDDSYDVAPGLLTVPQNRLNGYIQATYPEFQVQAGDKLQTLVNCEFGATGCYATFRIDYILPNNTQRTLWSWREAYDRRFYRANLDLTPLAGQKVRFVFMLLASGTATADRAIWGSPRILRTGTTQPPAAPATLTPLPPPPATATPLSQPPPTIAPTGCDKAAFVADVNVPDGTTFSPGQAFTKTWRLKNVGSCVWTTAYKLIYYSGDQMNAPTFVNLPAGAAFGQTVDISVNMVAPSIAGGYRGYWILNNANGQYFGIGTDASKPIWIDIKVAGDSPTDAIYYDFMNNMCSAEWKSSAGILSCPGTDNDARGFVLSLNPARLEDGSVSAPGILAFPQNRYNGYIQGYYPAFTVQPGDKFVTAVSCEQGSNCYVTFRLDYMLSTGFVGTFWQVRESNNGRYTPVNVDLTPLAGRSVRFILSVLATGTATGDRAVWAAPRIYRPSSTPPTLTPVPPTVTATPSIGIIVPSPSIGDLRMIDASNGWAFGNSSILRTMNGGATWYNVNPPDTLAIVNGFFQNAMKGWVLATRFNMDMPTLFRTTNGGASWTAYDNIPFDGGTMQFLDDMNGFVMAGLPSGMQKHAVQIYQTADGGATWTLKFANDPSMPDNTLPFSGHKYGMGFRDTSTGWVGGDYPSNGYFYFFKSTDGGVSWVQQALPFPAGYQEAFVTVTGPTFFSSTEGILPVRMTIGPDKQDLFLYVTHNGGSTWTPSLSFARNGSIVDHVTQRDAFSWNGNNFLATNTTGGSWRTITSNVNFGGSIQDYDFVSTTTGWVVDTDLNGHTALYKTTNGGTTWTALYSTIPTQPTAELSLSNIRIEYQNPSCLVPGDANGVRVWVTNSGQAAAGSFVVRVNGVDQSVNGLGIGETATLFFPGYTELVPSTVDVTNAVIESNENNFRLDFLSVPPPPPPCTNPIDFAQTVVTTLNAKNFSTAKNLMGQSFTFGYWQSQGTSYSPDEAVLQLPTFIGPNTILTPDPNKDLNTLLGGLNPYSIMGLDPSNSLGLFVSGWGLDGKGEAILYVTRKADGSLYWHSVLIAPTGFVAAVPTTASALQGPYAVARVAPNDVLNIRSGAGNSLPVIGWFPPDATHIMSTGVTATADGVEWKEIQKLDGGLGWVNASYLTEYVTNDVFCGDARIPILIEQLKGSVNQSNGDMLASLIGTHGAAINFWRDVPAVNYTSLTARNIFTDATIYNWGTGPAAGPTGTMGTFAQVVQPDLVGVFNSSYQLGCENPSYAAGMSPNPWPYTNIHYYSITQPATANMFDWKVWLIGFEYVNGSPYLYNMTHYVWEP